MIRVDPKSSDSCPYTRKTEVDSRQKRRRKRRSPCDHEAEAGGTHPTAPPRAQERPEAPEGGRGRKDPPPEPRKGA